MDALRSAPGSDPMKTTLSLACLCLVLLASIAMAQSEPTRNYLVQFTVGPNWDPALSPPEQAGFKEHSANLNRLRSDGVIAFGARYDDVGMIIIKAASLDDARQSMDADPGVKAGLFTFSVAELKVFYPWQP
jgi:uncharacterized protein YciI